MKKSILVLMLSFFVVVLFAATPNKYNLMIAPSTLTESAVTFLWDKQYGQQFEYAAKVISD
jgi:hypothetical protein